MNKTRVVRNVQSGAYVKLTLPSLFVVEYDEPIDATIFNEDIDGNSDEELLDMVRGYYGNGSISTAYYDVLVKLEIVPVKITCEIV
tara:strand:- start:267 stop:524 length:258 start_codon:yes stop_codon:yes gene_type:complete